MNKWTTSILQWKAMCYKIKCTDLQQVYVEVKTYRMAVGVNGQIPGPTIIVHHGQEVVIHVHNNMSTEGNLLVSQQMHACLSCVLI